MEILYYACCGAAGLITGLVICRLFMSRKAETLRISFDRDRAVFQERISNLAARETESVKRAEENLRLTGENARLAALLEQERKASAEKLALLEKAKEQLKIEFENISNRIFKEKGEETVKLNEKSITGILSPLKEQLKDFREKVEKAYDSESRERHTLKAEIEKLAAMSEATRKGAENLTNALKGNKKQQGCWGEFILETVLEESGLRRGHEYEIQVSGKNEEGEMQQPDVVVHLPDDKAVIIDSKLTLNSYEEYVSASDDDARESFLKTFTAGIRNHIRSLAGKSYQDLYGIKTLDYVLMFIPIESAFVTALESRKELFAEAFKDKIVLVSPATLLVVLKTIKSIWQVKRQEMNAEEIAKKAAKLYDKLYDFIENFRKIGKKLQDAQDAYNDAHGQLSSGKGNLVSRTEYFRKLGVNPKKELRDIVPDIDEDENNNLITN